MCWSFGNVEFPKDLLPMSENSLSSRTLRLQDMSLMEAVSDMTMGEKNLIQKQTGIQVTVGDVKRLFEAYKKLDVEPHTLFRSEILHTWLLGIVKYVVDHTISVLKRMSIESQNCFISAMSEVDFRTLYNVRLTGSYVLKHNKALIGKDYRALIQCLPWVLDAIGFETDEGD